MPPSEKAGSHDCLGPVGSSEFVDANGSGASFHWKLLLQQKSTCMHKHGRDHIFQSVWQGLHKGIAHTVYLAAASNRYLELGERLLRNAELIPSKGSIFKMSM